jgi:hypothetical protein
VVDSSSIATTRFSSRWLATAINLTSSLLSSWRSASPSQTHTIDESNNSWHADNVSRTLIERMKDFSNLTRSKKKSWAFPSSDAKANWGVSCILSHSEAIMDLPGQHDSIPQRINPSHLPTTGGPELLWSPGKGHTALCLSCQSSLPRRWGLRCELPNFPNG